MALGGFGSILGSLLAGLSIGVVESLGGLLLDPSYKTLIVFGLYLAVVVVLGMPEISSDGFKPYLPAIRDAFGNRVAHGVVTKTYSVTHLTVTEASRRYSPAAVVAVSRDVVSGIPMEISTSYAERGNLSLRMACRRFTRLTNAFSKKLENHAAAVALYVAHYNFCRVHETLGTTPAIALGITDHVWSIGELIDAALTAVPPKPTPTAPDRRRRFRVIEGGKK